MKIKFKLLIALFCLTMQSIALAEPKNPSEASSIPYFFIILIVLLVVSNLITLYALFFRKSNNSKSESLDYEKTRINKQNNSSFFELQSAQERNKRLVEESITLRERVDELTSENNALHEKVISLEQELHIEDITPLISKVEEVQHDLKFISATCKSQDTQFFLKESKVKNQTTPYVIFENGNEFYFKFDESNPSARSNAFNFHNIYMEGYCDGVNIRTDTHTSFEGVKDSVGKLKKDGDKYLVVERIKVNYLGGN